MEFLKKNCENRTTYDPAIPLVGFYLKKRKTPAPEPVRTRLLAAALFTAAEICREPKCSLADARLKKVWYLFTVEYYLAMKRKSDLNTN